MEIEHVASICPPHHWLISNELTDQGSLETSIDFFQRLSRILPVTQPEPLHLGLSYHWRLISTTRVRRQRRPLP